MGRRWQIEIMNKQVEEQERVQQEKIKADIEGAGNRPGPVQIFDDLTFSSPHPSPPLHHKSPLQGRPVPSGRGPGGSCGLRHRPGSHPLQGQV